MTIPLQKTCIYGPVNSRRLGRSLGINLLPSSEKICTFNCIYCQYGETSAMTGDFPDVREIVDAVEEVIGQEPEVDHLTLSGNGEAMLHPKFSIIVDAIKNIRDVIMPHVPLVLLTNGTEFRDTKKRDTLKLIDKVIVKMDVTDDASLQKINRPLMPINFKDYLRYISMSSPILTQTLFFDGSITNCDNRTVEEWYKIIKGLKPKVAQIYSLDRPTADTRIRTVPTNRLNQICKEGQRITKVKIEAFNR